MNLHNMTVVTINAQSLNLELFWKKKTVGNKAY